MNRVKQSCTSIYSLTIYVQKLLVMKNCNFSYIYPFLSIDGL